MRQFELKRTLLGSDITAQVTMLDEGVHILLTGGTRSHVGAAALAQGGNLLSSPSFPGHREQVIAEHWAKSLSERTGDCVTVACGIHYDHITPEQIQAVLETCEKLLGEILLRIEEEKIS